MSGTKVKEPIKPSCCSEHNKVVTWAKLVVLVGLIGGVLNLLGVSFASNQEVDVVRKEAKRNREEYTAVVARIDKRLEYIEKRLDSKR